MNIDILGYTREVGAVEDNELRGYRVVYGNKA